MWVKYPYKAFERNVLVCFSMFFKFFFC